MAVVEWQEIYTKFAGPLEAHLKHEVRKCIQNGIM